MLLEMRVSKKNRAKNALFKDVDKGNGRFGHTPIVAMSIEKPCATFSTLKFVIIKVDITGSQFGFQTPATGERPLITDAQSPTDIPTFVAMILQTFDESEGELDISGIEASAQGVSGEEPAVKAFTRPIAKLGLHEDVLEFGIVAKLERIEAYLKVESRLSSRADFQTKVGSRSRVVEEVVFQNHLLRLCVDDASGKENEEQPPFFHYSCECHICGQYV